MFTKKRWLWGVWIISSGIFLWISMAIPYSLLSIYDEDIIVTTKEFQDYLKPIGFVYPTITTVVAIDEQKDQEIQQYTVDYKLFNLFNILSLKVDVVEDRQVYAGGNAVGFVLDTKGVILVGSNGIITKDGLVDTLKGSQLRIGDVITKLNAIEVNSMEDIATVLQVHLDGKAIDVEYKRNGQIHYTTIQPVLDELTKQYKLGLWVKDNAVGVGTLTYVKQNLEYGALGHAITDVNTTQPIEVIGGQLYLANVVGVKKGVEGVPGELMGLFIQGKDAIGNIDKNTNYGVYGNILENSSFLEKKALIPLGSRSQAKPGKAKILTCIDGENIEAFDVEIIKTNYQASATEKSMIIKVTDKELLERTGGIVQGMSGSPIIQEGKLIGAVTHVFVSDPTKGFGLYIDWMLSA